MFHLINQFINCILDCLITWTADQKSQGNLSPGDFRVKTDLLLDRMLQLISNLTQIFDWRIQIQIG